MYKQILDNKMPKQAIKYDYIHHCLNIVGILVLYVLFVYLWNKFEWWDFLIYPISILALGIIVFGFITPVIRMKNTSFEIGDRFLEIQNGLYFQKRTVYPFDRIQSIKLEHGPISRRLDIYFIEVITAGNRRLLPMLNRETAEQTRTMIMQKVKEVTDDV
nr:PH domain-containing protein [Mammaliicoccus sp. Marseille-Q6498]